MKIAFIGQKGIPAQTGGVEKYVESLAEKIVAQGHEVFVYSHHNYSRGLKEYKGIKIISLQNLPGKNLEAISHTFLACLDLIFRPVDIIHWQSIGPASLMWIIKIFKPRTPIIFTFHCQDYYHQKWSGLARWCLKLGEKVGCHLATEIITISKDLTAYVAKTYGRTATYIPNGSSISERASVREIRRWGLEENNYFLSVSRLIRHKGIHHLITAYQELKTDKKLVIAGEGSYTDDYVCELHELAKGNDNIIFTGNQNGRVLTELFSNAYAFIQPSESEGLSIALLEAMSYGQACLVSNIPANIEALGEAGYLFENKNTLDLKNKLELLLQDSEKIASYGQAAQARIKQYFNWDDISQRMIEVYKKRLKK